MHQEHVRWHSPALGRDMELLVFGHGGTPVIAFPSSMGRYVEWRDFGMVDALTAQLEGGHNTLVCVDSVDAEALYNDGVPPPVRIARHLQYERYVMDEVVPFARSRGNGDALMVAGASFGGYHAANFFFKYPGTFVKVISLSGAYDVKPFLDGYYDTDVYFSNPLDYLPGLDDPGALDALRRGTIVLTTGEYDPCKDANVRLSAVLNDKGIPHHLDVEQGAFGHDWPWWREQIRRHIV